MYKRQVYDCAYCVNRRSNDTRRAAFTPQELADLTINFYRRNYIEAVSYTHLFFKITLLQMVKRIIPPMSNEIITLVKDTSLARIISIMELTKVGESYIKAQGITWPLF